MNPDFRDILSEFIAAGVEFLVVGAYAMAAHSLPRATGDIDLWVRCNAENARRIFEALARFGAPSHGSSEKDFLEPGWMLQLGVTPSRVDILTEIDGVEFAEAWPARLVVVVEGVTVPVIGREHLVRNKKATGRLKDAVDVKSLEQAP